MVIQESQHHLLNESLDLECHLYRMQNVFIFFQTYIVYLVQDFFSNPQHYWHLGPDIILVVEGCPVQCKIQTGIPGLYPLDVSSRNPRAHTHTHILVICKKEKKRRKVSRFAIHPLDDKITPLENDWSSHSMLLFFFIASCFFFISSLCVYTCADPSLGRSSDYFPIRIWPRTQGAFLNHPALSPINRCTLYENFHEIGLSFTPEQAVSSKKRGFVPVFISSSLALSLAQGRGSITIGGWMDEWILLLPTSHQQLHLVRSKQTKDAYIPERSPDVLWRNSQGQESLCVPGHTSDEMCVVSCLIPCSPQLWRCTQLLKNKKRRAVDSWHVVSWKSRINSDDSKSPDSDSLCQIPTLFTSYQALNLFKAVSH